MKFKDFYRCRNVPKFVRNALIFKNCYSYCAELISIFCFFFIYVF